MKALGKFLGSMLRAAATMVLLAVLTVGGCVFYAFKIEPYRVKVNEYRLAADRLAEGDGRQVRIAQISDLHIKEDFTCKDLEKVIDKINRQKPDILVFTGDLYDNYAKYHDDGNLIASLESIEAGYAKIAVWGNRDYGGGASRKYGEIMEAAGFTLLKNENLAVTVGDGRQVLVTGLDDALFGDPHMPEQAEGEYGYRILVTHEPDPFDGYMAYDYDIALSGHSHGGQVDIPFMPEINERAVTATALSTKYSGGMYEFPDAGIKKLYVNTGIGTTHISARFGVVPEVALFLIGL